MVIRAPPASSSCSHLLRGHCSSIPTFYSTTLPNRKHDKNKETPKPDGYLNNSANEKAAKKRNLRIKPKTIYIEKLRIKKYNKSI